MTAFLQIVTLAGLVGVLSYLHRLHHRIIKMQNDLDQMNTTLQGILATVNAYTPTSGGTATPLDFTAIKATVASLSDAVNAKLQTPTV